MGPPLDDVDPAGHAQDVRHDTDDVIVDRQPSDTAATERG